MKVLNESETKEAHSHAYIYAHTHARTYTLAHVHKHACMHAHKSKFRPTSACVGLGALLRPNVGPKYRKKCMKLV